MIENLNQKYGLIEIIRGKYHDKKLNQTLIVKQNYVEISGDDFQKQMVAMILYAYDGGRIRTELSSVFFEYAEENLELIEATEPETVFNLNLEGITGGIVQSPKEIDNVPFLLSPEEYPRGERIITND